MEMVKRYDKPVAYYYPPPPRKSTTCARPMASPYFTAVVETIRALEMSYRHYSRMQEIRSAEQTPTSTSTSEAVR